MFSCKTYGNINGSKMASNKENQGDISQYLNNHIKILIDLDFHKKHSIKLLATTKTLHDMAATTTVDIQNGHITDTTKYGKCKLDIYDEIDKLLKAKQRFQCISERQEKSVFDAELIAKISKGKYTTRWRGLSMMKDCLDMVIYQQLLWEVKPRTIFETGAYTGACALWMSDTMKIYDLPVHVYSIDINMDLVDPKATSDPNVTIKKGDAKKILQAYPEELLKTCPHPWVISEDCHVDVVGVMEYFHEHMEVGDYFIIEDTSPDTPLISGQGLLNVEYHMWGRRKLDLMKNFLTRYSEFYQVDAFYTDYFGYNGTFNWDGYIKRVK